MSTSDYEQLDLGTATAGKIRTPRTPKLVSSGKGAIRPRARLIRTIGAELISSEIVAIAELVRNCYDADATRVELRFTDPHLKDSGRLEIADNGHGMSREILLGPWLEPATDHKSDNSSVLGGIRSPRGRRRLGSKGVGRFAAQRLGRHLLVRTATAQSRNLLEADFDWDALDNADQYLDELEIPWREVAGDRGWHGTSLQIDRLRDHWTQERFDRLRLSLSRLVGPGMGTDQFFIYLVINGVEERVEPTLERLPAMYRLEGTVEGGGRCLLTYRDTAGAEEVWERTLVWPPIEDHSCGPFQLSIGVWDLDREALEFYFRKHGLALGLRDFRRTVRDHSGVSLYRDGFRILPYGEPDNDWLRLDRRRVNNPTLRLSNNQIQGSIQLTADANPRLKDQTNREGLVSNESYTHLQYAVLEVLAYLEARRFRSRRQMGLGLKTGGAATSQLLRAQAPKIRALLDRMETQGFLQGDDSVAQLRSLLEENQRAAVEAVRQYADMAASGHLSGLVFTQLRHPIVQIQTELACLRELLELADLNDAFREDADASVEKIQRILIRMSTTMTRLDPLAVPRRGRQAVETSLEDCIDEVVEVYSDRFVRSGVDVAVVILENSRIECEPHLIQGAVALILENAEYWLQKRSRNRRLQITVLEGGVDIENNGPAIPKEIRDQVFEPYFTTREDAAGMGLALARDLLGTLGGSIRLRQEGRAVQFQIRLHR